MRLQRAMAAQAADGKPHGPVKLTIPGEMVELAAWLVERIDRDSPGALVPVDE